MKTILLGEFSGFHTTLRDGLRAVGVDASVVATRDGVKSIPVDYDIGSDATNYVLAKAQRLIRGIEYVGSLPNVDLVQLVSPVVFLSGITNRTLIKILRRKTSKLFLSACGEDAFYVNNRHKLRYSPIEDYLAFDLKSDTHPMATPSATRWNRDLTEIVDGIIPVMYEYEAVYDGQRNLRSPIPLPVNTDLIKQAAWPSGSKILVMHGATRPGAKGSRHILQAFQNLSARYPNDFEFLTPQNMPLHKYMDYMRGAHVVVDQTSGYSCGMNSLFALAMGKVVLGGAEPESLGMYAQESTPVVNIEPNVQTIEVALETLLDRKASLENIGSQGRQFVERNHHYKKIARLYVDEWART